MKPVFSSHVQSVGYDEATGDLLVNWNTGRISAYEGVPPELAESVSRAPSVGEALHAMIKPKFKHRYVK